MIKTSSTIAWAIGIAACSSWIAGVPKEMRGATPMRVTNWTDTPVCKFWLTPASRPPDRDADWLGKLGKLQPGETRLYNIKPGDYTMTLHGCDKKFDAEQPIHVERSLAVAIGEPQERPMAGYALLRANAVGHYGRYVRPAYVNNGGGGESGGGESGEAPAESGGETAAAPSGPACKPNGVEVSTSSECCSGYTEQRGTLHNGGRSFCCGPAFADCHNTE